MRVDIKALGYLGVCWCIACFVSKMIYILPLVDVRGAGPDRRKASQTVEETDVDLFGKGPVDRVVSVFWVIEIDNVTTRWFGDGALVVR